MSAAFVEQLIFLIASSHFFTNAAGFPDPSPLKEVNNEYMYFEKQSLHFQSKYKLNKKKLSMILIVPIKYIVCQISSKSEHFSILAQKLTGVTNFDKNTKVIKFSMFHCVPNFIEIWTLFDFGPNWPKNWKVSPIFIKILKSLNLACFIC